jgi:2,4-dienoyl-CoA reductase-like NADH-dependent reductase (Old Yellow Enzyme family)
MDSLDPPITLRCGLDVPQRIAMAPLTNTQSEADGTLGDDELTWMTLRARGGFRWISTCAAFVCEEGHAWKGQLGIASDSHLPGLTRLAGSLREFGAAAVVQLYHGGAKAALSPGRPLSAVDGGPTNSRGASPDDIHRVTTEFVAAARRAEQAGFAGVEIHGANGYLFTQFLTPADNTRDDGYGGDLAGRARFLRETLCAVRSAVSPGFAVGVRLSPVDVVDRRGLVLDDGVRVAGWLVDDGADFIHLSLKDAAGPPPHEPERGPVARAFREALPEDIPVFAAGGIWTRGDAVRATGNGVDVVVLGHAAIAHPDWPRRSAEPGWQPVRPPWSPEYLTSVGVGPGLLAYLRARPGAVTDGVQPRP